MATSNFVAS
jgi:hypothetical protein